MIPPLTIEVLDASGASLGELDTPLLSAPCEYRLYGGCHSAKLTFAQEWADDPPVTKDDLLKITSVSCPVFYGRVAEARPVFGGSRTEVEVEGWWRRLDELQVVPDLADRVVFGVADDSDHEDILTAGAALQWLFTNVIVPDAISPVSASSIVQASAPCKFGDGGFAIYAGDKLTKVLETLAAMDDCVTGIDAEGVFYWAPRSSLTSQLASVRAAENVSGNWKVGNTAWATGGTFAYDRRGPNVLRVTSRDANFAPGVRVYRYVTSPLGAATSRVASFYAPGVRTGQGARRLARGLFRRFKSSDLRVEDLEGVAPNNRYEPHRGKVTVYSDAVQVAEDLCGSISVDWVASVLKPSFSLGENKLDPGSGNPINDPFDPGVPQSPPDDPTVDTGDGEEDPTYPLPSGPIDDDDDHDGDGDDLHENPDRDNPDDPPGPGVDGVDYGTDKGNPGNGKLGIPAPGGTTLLAKIIAVHISEVSTTTEAPLYDIQVFTSFNPDTGTGALAPGVILGCPAAPDSLRANFYVGQVVPVFQPTTTVAEFFILNLPGGGGGTLFFGTIEEVSLGPPITYSGIAFTQDAGSSDAIFQDFEGAKSWPYAAPAFEVGADVLLYYQSPNVNPFVLAMGNGGDTVVESIVTSWLGMVASG